MPSPDSGRAPRMPDTLVIVMVLALIAWAMTFLVTPGRFDVTAGSPPRLVPGSFVLAEGPRPAPLFGTDGVVGLTNMPFEGLVTGSRTGATIGLMAFLLVLGGVFGIVTATGAIDRSLGRLLVARGGSDGLILGMFIAFSLAGAVFGMSEEAIAITLILTPALVRAGYDSLTALAACFVATQVGFATSWMNPFGLVIAQAVAGLAPLSGLELRLGMFALFTALGAGATLLYARRVRARPELSLVHASDRGWIGTEVGGGHEARRGDMLVLGLLAATVIWVGWGVMAKGWFLPEIAAQFMAMGLAVAVAGRVFGLLPDGFDGAARAFREGAAQLLPAVLVVGLAKGILLLAGGEHPESYSLFNSFLNAAAGFTGLLPEWMTAWGMLVVQSVINFFITSGSGQAAVTMPLMAPLADLSGVTRQTAVLAYQLGGGLTDLIVPTSASLMGCLAAARVDFGVWLRFIWKPMLGAYALASLFVIGAHLMGYS